MPRPNRCGGSSNRRDRRWMATPTPTLPSSGPASPDCGPRSTWPKHNPRHGSSSSTPSALAAGPAAGTAGGVQPCSRWVQQQSTTSPDRAPRRRWARRCAPPWTRSSNAAGPRGSTPTSPVAAPSPWPAAPPRGGDSFASSRRRAHTTPVTGAAGCRSIERASISPPRRCTAPCTRLTAWLFIPASCSTGWLPPSNVAARRSSNEAQRPPSSVASSER